MKKGILLLLFALVAFAFNYASLPITGVENVNQIETVISQDCNDFATINVDILSTPSDLAIGEVYISTSNSNSTYESESTNYSTTLDMLIVSGKLQSLEGLPLKISTHGINVYTTALSNRTINCNVTIGWLARSHYNGDVDNLPCKGDEPYTNCILENV